MRYQVKFGIIEKDGSLKYKPFVESFETVEDYKLRASALGWDILEIVDMDARSITTF